VLDVQVNVLDDVGGPKRFGDGVKFKRGHRKFQSYLTPALAMPVVI